VIVENRIFQTRIQQGWSGLGDDNYGWNQGWGSRH